MPYFREFYIDNESVSKEKVCSILKSHQTTVFVYGACKHRIEIQRNKREGTQKSQGGEIMLGLKRVFVSMVNVKSQYYQHVMIKEVLIGMRTEKCFGKTGSVRKNRRKHNRYKRADSTRGVHKGV